jgi:hypothetical protein
VCAPKANWTGGIENGGRKLEATIHHIAQKKFPRDSDQKTRTNGGTAQEGISTESVHVASIGHCQFAEIHADFKKANVVCNARQILDIRAKRTLRSIGSWDCSSCPARRENISSQRDYESRYDRTVVPQS